MNRKWALVLVFGWLVVVFFMLAGATCALMVLDNPAYYITSLFMAISGLLMVLSAVWYTERK